MEISSISTRSERGSISSFLLLYILALSTFQFRLCSSRFSPIHTTSPTASKGGTRIVLPLSGNVEPKAYFSADFKIGHPQMIFDLDVDTGSSLTWVQCDAPCEAGCSRPKNEQYKPKKENLVRCDHPICKSVSEERCRNPGDKCNYEIKYTDGSNTTGFLVSDNFQLHFTNGTTITPRLVFGCGYKQYFPEGHPNEATGGLLGFSNGENSILSQLRGMGIIKNVGGHCLSSKGGGFIFLGDVPAAASSNIAWVPRNKEEEVYITGPAKLFHGRSLVTVIDGMGTLFDSGSTYTNLSPKNYETVLNQIEEDVKAKPLQKSKNKKSDICWKSTKKPFKSLGEVKRFFKPFMLKFANNKELQIPPEAYLILLENGDVCLGFDKVNDDTNTVTVGDVSMQDTMMIFDNEKKEIGWVSPANCNNIPKS